MAEILGCKFCIYSHWTVLKGWQCGYSEHPTKDITQYMIDGVQAVRPNDCKIEYDKQI